MSKHPRPLQPRQRIQIVIPPGVNMAVDQVAVLVVPPEPLTKSGLVSVGRKPTLVYMAADEAKMLAVMLTALKGGQQLILRGRDCPERSPIDLEISADAAGELLYHFSADLPPGRYKVVTMPPPPQPSDKKEVRHD